MSELNVIELLFVGTNIPISTKLCPTSGNSIGADKFELLLVGLNCLPSEREIPSKPSVLVTRVRPPSKVKYGTLPLILFEVLDVNARLE